MSATLQSWLADPVAWVSGGILLMLIELLIPGFLMLGFGLGALGLALALWLSPPLAALPPLALLAMWAALSLLTWLALSKCFGQRARRRSPKSDINDFENR